MFKPNEGKADRVIRAIAGIIFLLVAFFTLSGISQVILYIVAAILLLTALTGYCGLYKLLGINTKKK
ncbi:MAG: DUF2892 domain-containing protein [Candidatus Magasanikbacteria bacterium]|nr:DUF2892 domain-containing protein [Candidatus Magasanikbacteria bacterium]